MNKKLFLLIIIMTVSSGFAYYFSSFQTDQNNTNGQITQSNDTPANEPAASPAQDFDKTKYSTEELGSIWLIVNKQRPIPKDYKPELGVPSVNLRLSGADEQMHIANIALEPLTNMFKAADTEGVNLVFGSGYRSYSLQKSFYDSYVARDGQAAADTYSARPGTSEHQTGLAFDATNSNKTCHLEICFEETPGGKWLASHAYEYGFVLRYIKGKENITGYQYEPWHFRYVGKELAAELHSSGQTLEEFFGLVN